MAVHLNDPLIGPCVFKKSCFKKPNFRLIYWFSKSKSTYLSMCSLMGSGLEPQLIEEELVNLQRIIVALQQNLSKISLNKPFSFFNFKEHIINIDMKTKLYKHFMILILVKNSIFGKPLKDRMNF